MCCSGFLKIMMFVFNGVIFLAGAAILGVGIWVKVDSSSLLGFLDDVDGSPSELSQLANVGYLLIALGAVLVVLGFLGCCGAIRESRCMLLTFFSIVLIIFLAEVAGAVVLLVFTDLTEQILRSLESEVKKSLQRSYGKTESFTALWNGTMEEFQCCGFANYTDFNDSPYVMNSGMYPEPCCNKTITVGGDCTMDMARMSNVDGCLMTLKELIEENSVIVAAVALGIAALEVAAMVVSMVLYKDIGNKA